MRKVRYDKGKELTEEAEGADRGSEAEGAIDSSPPKSLTSNSLTMSEPYRHPAIDNLRAQICRVTTVLQDTIVGRCILLVYFNCKLRVYQLQIFTVPFQFDR